MDPEAMDPAPPLSVSFCSSDGPVDDFDDGCSELTDPCDVYDGLPTGDEAAGGPRPCEAYYRPSSSKRIEDADTIRRQQREIIALKLQLARRGEQLDVLASRLGQSQIENEALKAERTALVDELANAREVSEERSVATVPARKRLFGHIKVGGTMQMLADANAKSVEDNAKLVEDNARLRASVDGIRRALEGHIKCNARSGRADKEAIENLRHENNMLRQQLGSQDALAKRRPSSEETAETNKTSLESDVSDENLNVMNRLVHAYQETLQTNPHTTFDDGPTEQVNKLDISSSTWIIEGQDIEATVANKALVEHKDQPASPRRRSEELLVEFGETARAGRRARSSARRWHSLKR